MLLIAFSFIASAQAQQPAAPTPAPPPAAPSPDPKLIKEYESILQQKFTRDPSELLRHLERVGTSDPATLSANDRFQLRFVTGDWAKLGEELKQMPPDLAVKIYNKMLADLTENRKPVVRLDDIIALSDVSPTELNNDNIRRLGQLLGVAVPMSESFWLVDRLQKGTAKFGGTDPGKRLLAARVLIAGNFRDLARTYLPGNDQIAQITDEGVRNELMAFVATQEQRESTQRSEVQKIWDENIRELLEPPSTGKNKAWEKQKPISNISKIITQVPVSTLAPVFTELVKSNPETAMKLLTALERKVQNDRNGEVVTRTQNIAVQANVANLLCDLVKPGEQPWTQVIEMMADVWASEAENTFTQKATNNPQRFVLPEDLMPQTDSENRHARLDQLPRGTHGIA